MKKIYYILFFIFISVRMVHAQTKVPPVNPPDTIPLMLWEPLQIEATDAINQMYNFKFEIAEEKFRDLEKRFPKHPLPSYLLGLSNWWKMMPYHEEDPRLKTWEDGFLKNMEIAMDKADAIYDNNDQNLEAIFFLCAGHAQIARFYAETSREMKAINHAGKVFKYFKKLNDNNDFSPEFLFGSALFNYYAAWFKEEYPILSPVLMFFPKGNKELGIKQLKEVTFNAFWTRTEAQYFLMRIYYNEENNDRLALEQADYLAKTFPDNAYFQRIYARLLYSQGRWVECKEISENILYKLNISLPGYEETAGRYACFFLGNIYKNSGDKEKAKDYYTKTISYAEKSYGIGQNYHLYSIYELAQYAVKENDKTKADDYYKQLEKHSKNNKELKKRAENYFNPPKPPKEKPSKEKSKK